MKAETILAQAIADLKARQHVTLADLEPGEIVALVHACEKVANPFEEVNADTAGFPVLVNESVYFWPLTIGAACWLEATADKWWAENPCWYRNALIYAAINARCPDAFGMMLTKTDVEHAIRDCLRRVTATSAEVDAALERVLGLDPTVQTSNRQNLQTSATATSWAALLAKVEAATGISRQHWLWGVSYRETLRAYHEARQLALAVRGEHAARMLDELDDAVNRLQRLKVNLMKRVGVKSSSSREDEKFHSPTPTQSSN